ncbi:MAG: GtrA family protein [Proteobacteria bacterium]|nr:GtrA family protein [Pseudomonadota bacterium]
MKPRRLATFLKFATVSGMGWIMDALILLALVSQALWNPFYANIVSSCVAATCVFLFSREVIFRKVPRVLHLRLAAYLGYTLCIILLASAAIGLLVGMLAAIAGSLNFELPATAAAAIAKVIVTPPQLVANFVVSRFLSERTFKEMGH